MFILPCNPGLFFFMSSRVFSFERFDYNVPSYCSSHALCQEIFKIISFHQPYFMVLSFFRLLPQFLCKPHVAIHGSQLKLSDNSPMFGYFLSLMCFICCWYFPWPFLQALSLFSSLLPDPPIVPSGAFFISNIAFFISRTLFWIL